MNNKKWARDKKKTLKMSGTMESCVGSRMWVVDKRTV